MKTRPFPSMFEWSHDGALLDHSTSTKFTLWFRLLPIKKRKKKRPQNIHIYDMNRTYESIFHFFGWEHFKFHFKQLQLKHQTHQMRKLCWLYALVFISLSQWCNKSSFLSHKLHEIIGIIKTTIHWTKLRFCYVKIRAFVILVFF